MKEPRGCPKLAGLDREIQHWDTLNSTSPSPSLPGGVGVKAPSPTGPVCYHSPGRNLNLSTGEWPGALSRVPDDRGVGEMEGRGGHSPEPGRDTSLGSSRIPRICVLWEKHSRLTVTPVPDPNPPPSPLPIYARPGPSFRRPGRPRSSGPAEGGTPVRGQQPGRPEPRRPGPKARHPPGSRPNPGRPRWGRGPPAAPAPTAPPAAERVPSEWSSLNIHFMAAAGKGRSRPSEPRDSGHRPKQQRQRRRRRRRR